MFPLLAIPLALGYVLARRYLRRDVWPALLGESAALAVVLTVIGVNGVYRYLGSTTYRGWTALEISVAVTLAAQALVLALLLWKAPPKLERQALNRTAVGLLVVLSAVIVVYTNAQQIANPDDDYWIHAPLQGLMRHGNFPPFNPFFSDIPMNGHYGRNLGIVTFSAISGCDVFMSQHLLTSGLQVLTFWIFFAAFWRSSGRWQAGLLASTFVFFGINAGGRGGLIDTMQNNNAFVHLYLALLLSLIVDVWKNESKTATLLCGLTLGGYAIVYETHFGLVAITIASLTPLLLLRGAISKKAAALAAASLVISLPLAFTQGGPLTDILKRHQEGRQHSQAENLSRGMQNQAQVVKITFPKKELFQILLETGEYQRVAQIYTLDTPLRRLHTPSIDRGYAYIWSWDVLKIHFLPLYLFPLSFVILWRRKSLAGHFMGAFGVIAFLTPALVHFGPIYESEYYRWEFAAALGFSACLGLALAELVLPKLGQPDGGVSKEHQGSLPFAWRAPNFAISRQGLKLLALGAITLLNSWACLTFVAQRLSKALPGSPMGWLVFPSTESWLSEHQVLDFGALDYQAATWLSAQGKPGDRLLTNFRQENNFSILYESTLTGLTGIRCVGHALPLEDEKIGTTPFRRAPAAIAFWDTYRGDPLALLKVDWVLYRNDRGEELPPLPGAKLMHRVQDGKRLRLIYKIDQSLLPKLSPPPAAQPSGPARQASLGGAPPLLRGGRLVSLDLSAAPGGSGPLPSGVLELSTVRRSDGLVSSPSENLRWRMEPDQDGTWPPVPFVPPYDEGQYDLNARWLTEPGSASVQVTADIVDVGFLKALEKVKIARTVFSPSDGGQGGKVWPTRVLITPETYLKLPQPWTSENDVLACWAFYSEEREEFDLLPALNMQQVVLDQNPLRLPMVTPERPGEYRLALYLSGGQGHLTRLPLGKVTIADRPGGEP